MGKELNLEFPEVFRPLLTQKARYKIMVGGRGSAKSWSAARAAIVKAVSRRIRVLCCREIQSSIRESVHKLLSDSIAQMGLSDMFTINEREIKCNTTGSEFIFEGLFRNVQRVKSLESIDICWIEEGQTISAESLELLIPTIRNPESEIWICFNPAYESDVVWKRFMVDPPDNAIIIKAGWQDNPWFPDVLKKEMEDDYAYRPEAAKNIWGGELKRSGSFVWVPPYDRAMHVKEFNLKDVGEYKVFQALDPHTAFYSFALWAARWKQGDRYVTWVYDEYPTRADVGDDYVNIRKKLHYNGTVADLARAFFAKEGSTKITQRFIDTRFCKGFGSKQSNLVNTTEGLVQSFAKPDNGGVLYLMPQEKNIDAANDVIKKDFQYNKLAPISPINEPALYISAKCKNLILALTNHRFEEDEEKEMEEYKDASDCLTILYGGLGEYRWPKKSTYNPGYSSGSWMG